MNNDKKIKPDDSTDISLLSSALHQEIRKLIYQACCHVAGEYNSTQILLNGMIGKRIDEEFFK
jgi:thiamine pyrophosphokinase